MYCWLINIWVGIAIALLGITGNGVAFCTFGKMCNRNASTYLLRALALVDSWMLALYCTVNLNSPGLFSIENNWRNFIERCLLLPLLAIAHTATIWTILLVGVHRYIVVCHSLRAARLCTVGKAKRHFLGVLLLSFIVNCPMFFQFWIKEIHSNHTDPSVTYELVPTNMQNSEWYHTGYIIVFRIVIMSYVIPVGSLIFITARFCQSLRFSRQRRMELNEGQIQDQMNIRTEWMVIVVLILFLLCHTGYPVQALLSRFSFDILWDYGSPYCRSAHFVLVSLTDNMVLLNSSINIIIYLGFNRKFRKTLCHCVKSVTSRQNNQYQQRWHDAPCPSINISKEYVV